MKKSLIILISILYMSCNSQAKKESQIIKEKTQPNILWIVTEDISPTFSFYGDNTAKTPNLDVLANESIVYDNAFAVVGVCGPSRSSIITGMYPTSIGTMHMRTGKDIHSWGKREYAKSTKGKDFKEKEVIQYSAVIPDEVKCYTEYLRKAGYYCTNNQKTDYQFAPPITAWNENNGKAHWRNAPKGKPFFSVFNIGTTHESQLWKKRDLPLTVKPENVKVPPYLPDNDATRNTIARHYSNVELMDAEIGAFIKQLKDDGLYDNTIIFFYSDHGGPLPRQKREIYDSGLKVPFMIKGVATESGRTNRMISFVDLAPTMLSLAGLKAPDYMEGQAFLGEFNTERRKYIFGSSDRFDEITDRIRAVRNDQFLYLRNDFTTLPKYKDLGYRKNVPMMSAFLELKADNKLDKEEQLWFAPKIKEELYDCEKDPHNINNLAEDPEYASVLVEIRQALETHLKDRKDYGLIPESEMIEAMWPNFEQPITVSVDLDIENGLATLSSKTKGASIAYIISNELLEELDFNSSWNLYTNPVKLKKGDFIHTIAQRIGYKESAISQLSYKTR